tara:strand:- start:707 stop:3118 length:2412 start_codon:yes stop_codon:yes gene_type:complete
MTEKLKTQKSSLAKLMATENLTVVHKKIPTAYFDIQNRILACPTFKEDMSPELYDLFMGHEVGHALNTPFEGLHSTLKENRTLKGYLNVVEDVRIEKAIKNKYAGLRKSFYKAYNELMEKDFFGIKGRDLQTLSLIDKINLITKCGSRVSIELTDVEQSYLDMAEACKTWEDVVACAEAIYEYSKENETRDENDENLVKTLMDDLDFDNDENEEEDDDLESSFNGGEQEEDDEYEQEETYGGDAPGDSLPDIEEDEEEGEPEEESDDGDIKSTGSVAGKKGGSYDGNDGARESITEQNAHNNEEMFVDENACVNTNINLKEIDFTKIAKNSLYTYKEVLNDWRKYASEVKMSEYYKDGVHVEENLRPHNMMLGATLRKHLQNKNKKIVAHMAKEFEMRQTAQRSAKAFTGKSGELDMNRLAKYQIIDDVFKRVTYLPDGKNHGVNVLLDWSGSIANELSDLIEQSMILAEFCKKVQIPFRVYAFSDVINRKDDDSDWNRDSGMLVEFLSNEMSNREYTEMLDYISCILVSKMHDDLFGWRDVKEKQRNAYNAIFGEVNYFEVDHNYYDPRFEKWDMFPRQYGLGGTPLNHAIACLRYWLPEFNKKYGIEKSILTVITDGFSHESHLFSTSDAEHEDFKSQTEGEEYTWRIKNKRNIIDPYLNKTFEYEVKEGYSDRDYFGKTGNLLEWISSTCNVTVTGYFVFSKKRDFDNLLYNVKELEMKAYTVSKEWWAEVRKVGKVVNIKGYNKMFLTAASNLSTMGDDELDDELIGANKNRVMAAFKRNQKGKTTSRFLTNEFIKEIA